MNSIVVITPSAQAFLKMLSQSSSVVIQIITISNKIWLSSWGEHILFFPTQKWRPGFLKTVIYMSAIQHLMCKTLYWKQTYLEECFCCVIGFPINNLRQTKALYYHIHVLHVMGRGLSSSLLLIACKNLTRFCQTFGSSQEKVTGRGAHFSCLPVKQLSCKTCVSHL